MYEYDDPYDDRYGDYYEDDEDPIAPSNQSNQDDRLARILDSHDAWLKSGGTHGTKAAINRVRFEYPDMRGTDLRYADLEGIDLSTPRSKIELLESLDNLYLGRAEFRHSILVKCDLAYANLRRANLLGCDMRRSKLSYANMQEACLDHSDLSGATCIETDFQYVDFSLTRLNRVDLTRAMLRNSVFGGSVYWRNEWETGHTCSGTWLERCRLDGAILIDADLSFAGFMDCSFRGTVFAGVKLDNVVVEGCDFRGCVGLTQRDVDRLCILGPCRFDDHIRHPDL